MIIAIASIGKELSSKLSPHFSRAKYYIFINSETKEVEKIKENPFFEGHSPGEIPKFIKKEGASVLISGSMGQKAISWFKKLEIQPITSEIITVKTALDNYLNKTITDADSCNEVKK